LHDSDNWCGSLISLEDAAEILQVPITALDSLKTETVGSKLYVTEEVLRNAWYSGEIASPYHYSPASFFGSLDELILLRLFQLSDLDIEIEVQVRWKEKRRIDFRLSKGDQIKFVEFLGPSHFTFRKSKGKIHPLVRKKEIEHDFPGIECVLWPYWIQRSQINITAIFDPSIRGKGALWSTGAYFGKFKIRSAQETIIAMTKRFGAERRDGIGYMYTNEECKNKPDHFILNEVSAGKRSEKILIPPDAIKPRKYWIPSSL